MSACPAACIGFQKVGGIAVTGENNVACSICDYGIGMCGSIVKKLMDYIFGVCVGLACCMVRDPSAGSMVLSPQLA